MANDEHLRALLDRDEWAELLAVHRVQGEGDSQARIDLMGANLAGIALDGRDLYRVDLRGANLWHARLRGSDFTHADVSDANLMGADLSYTTLRFTVLSRTNMNQCSLEHATLYRSDLSDASLVGAFLSATVFKTAGLTNTDLSGAKCGGTVWSDVDFREMRNLERIVHYSGSTLGLDSILRSQGQIPEGFLRGSGVPDEVIAYVRSLAQAATPIQLYSCFISYSSKDQEFCQRLHNDLQAAGVRCWFAPEDLKIGDPFRDEIEQAIRLHDKLLLVFSEHSVNSPWVQTEVESALARERREGKRVLFPVRLDSAVLDASQAWALHVQLQRHIGDFSGWKDHDRYKKAFERLVRDLRAPATVPPVKSEKT